MHERDDELLTRKQEIAGLGMVRSQDAKVPLKAFKTADLVEELVRRVDISQNYVNHDINSAFKLLGITRVDAEGSPKSLDKIRDELLAMVKEAVKLGTEDLSAFKYKSEKGRNYDARRTY